MERMNRDLELTAAQRDRIGDILRETRFKVRESHLEFQHRRHELFWQALAAVRAALTPEQQQKFDRDFAQPWATQGGGGHEHGSSHEHDSSDDFAEPMQPAPQK